jgi:monoglucosyldiacylglycerol epimerase
MDYLILVIKTAIVFIVSSACFDVVHYILHRWETSRFALLRKLGGLHAVHHEFLDREMRIQRAHTWPNIFLHVLPEYGTAVVGILLMGFVFGWLPSLIVLALRTLMVVVYVFQKGEDITHKELTRIKANRGILWVGPHYHALHHVYVNQHYSSFVNVFDLLFGTNGQIEERRFLILGAGSAFGLAMAARLRALGGVVETRAEASASREELERTDVLIFAGGNTGTFAITLERFRDVAQDRLVPPEAWGLGYEYKAPDLTYRTIQEAAMPAGPAARVSLFFIRRGFSYVPLKLFAWLAPRGARGLLTTKS